MMSVKVVVVFAALIASSMAMPQLDCGNGVPYNADANTVDANGCTVGYCARVCPTGAVTNDGRFTTFRGNRGSPGTGSNGNAGPITANSLPVDPAAVTFLKQIE